MKKWWIKILVALATVSLVIFFLVATSSVHSRNAVDRYKDQLRAAGEKLDFNDVIPPRVDPDKNALDLIRQAFAAMPYPAAGILLSNPPLAMKMVAPGKAMVGSQQSEIISDSNPACTNSWDDLNQELEMRGPAIDFLRQASERSKLDFELDYNQGAYLLLPHLSRMKQAAILLSSASLADLHRGDGASAATNLHTLLLIVNQDQDEPLLISQLVRIAMAQIAVNAQWELLQSTNVGDPQLAMLQRDWTNIQFAQPLEKSLMMERVWGTRTIEQLRTSNSPSSIYSGWMSMGGPGSGGTGSGDWLDMLKDMGQAMKHKTADALWRVSWSYDDELKILQGDQVLVETMRQVHTNGYFKAALADRDRKLAALGIDRPGTNWLRNHLDEDLETLGSGSVQPLVRSIERVLNTEAAHTIATTAIALKRYQLRHGTLPGDLSALVPEFLPEVPRDPVDGHPLRYQVLPNGNFLLYSIGSDNIDNGGDGNTQAGSKSLQWLRGRDWVWPQPATAREVQNFRNLPP
ncbi:MAG TPA: hypothetical protein VHC44_18880 [Verrucomicrobiae bacterium]|nr:hypothetical protein [Verrucomicrobiae bacterium]